MSYFESKSKSHVISAILHNIQFFCFNYIFSPSQIWIFCSLIRLRFLPDTCSISEDVVSPLPRMYHSNSRNYFFQKSTVKAELNMAPVLFRGFPGGSAGQESACNAGDLGPIPRLGRSTGEGNGYPLQYSDLENSIDCIAHGIAKSRSQQSYFHFHFPCYAEL